MAIIGDYDEEDERSKLLRSHPPGYSNGVSSSAIIEHPHIYKSRWRSIRVMYLTMFLSSVSFSICMSSVWPYLKLLDPSAKADFLGWVVASYSLGQLVASPLFGAWANKRGKSREPLVVSLIINILANILYIYLESINTNRSSYLVVARTFIGFGAGNVAVVRSYVSGATTVKERTPTMANISAFQAVGFILGPAIQTAMVPIGYPGPVHGNGLHIDLYTSPAVLSAVCGIVNLVLLFVVFREHRVEIDDDINFSTSIQGSDLPDYSVDKIAVAASVFIFFIVLFLFSVFETIGTPLTMNMFSWTKSEATLYNGVILAVGGVVSILVFVVIKILSKRINERYILVGGFVFCFIGFFVYLPWGHNFPAYMDGTIKPASPYLPGNHTYIIENATIIPWTESTTNSTLTSQGPTTTVVKPFTLQNATFLPTTEIITSTELPTTKYTYIPINNGTLVPTSIPIENGTDIPLTTTEQTTFITEINIENATVIPTTSEHINITAAEIRNATYVHTTHNEPHKTGPTFVTESNIVNATVISTTSEYINITASDIQNATYINTTHNEPHQTGPTIVPTTTEQMNVTSTETENATEIYTTKHFLYNTTEEENTIGTALEHTTSPSRTFYSTEEANTIGTALERTTSAASVTSDSTKATQSAGTTIEHTTTASIPSRSTDEQNTLETTVEHAPIPSRLSKGDLPTGGVYKNEIVKQEWPSVFIARRKRNIIAQVEFSSTIEPNNASSQPLTENTTPNFTTPTTIAGSGNTTVEPVGCPDTYEWCRYTPVITLAQFLLGTLLICIGYPTCNVMSYAIYSKILGPKPQGIWMGVLTASGSLARTLGPIFVSQIYNSYGPRVTFSIVVGLILATFVLLLVVFKKLVPFAFTEDIETSSPKRFHD